MSDSEVKPEFSSLLLVSSARSTTLPIKAPTPVFPPSQFVDTIRDRRVALCPSSCFLLYSLNSAKLTFDTSQTSEVPFELFKECYHKNKSRFDLSKYFEVDKMDVPLDQELTFEGTTISETSKKEVSVLPLILKYHRTTANLNTEKHLMAHLTKLKALFKRFVDRKVSNLYINWLKLIESYVELVFRDLLVKWCQWLHTVRAMGHRRSVQTVLRMWLNRLCKQFWSRYFVFENGQRNSVNDMGRRLIRFAQASEWNLDGTSASYGVWIDSKNGIILFASGLVFEQVQVCPMYGTCIDQIAPEAITTKLLFYVNVAIIECFVNEIS